jgi:hypothetical protein
MIPIAPAGLCSGFTPGQTVKLADLIAKADIRDIRKSRGSLIFRYDTHSKHFYQNTCWCAGGKCDRCGAQECRDRNWREQGRDVP